MRIDLKKKILTVAIFPILLLGIVTIIITLTKVKASLMNEVKDKIDAMEMDNASEKVC